MEEKKNQEITGEDVIESPSKVSNFLPYGKYFLLAMAVIIQVLLAYTVVDKNYHRIYSALESSRSSETFIYPITDLIVNPANSNGRRYLVVELSLELKSEECALLIEKNIQKLKHNLNETLATRTVEQLVQFQEREMLRKELAIVTNRTIGENSVQNLYFTKYVMQ